MKKVNDWIDEHREEMIQYLAKLVRIPSINPWFSEYKEYTTEKKVQEFIGSSLEDMGFKVKVWDVNPEELKEFEGMPGYYEGRPMKDRPNLCALKKGSGNGKSLLLTGHADVVKVGEGWTKPPFDSVIENGKMYGRGTNDMKGGIAAMIMACRALEECQITLKGDLYVGTVSDEEAGGTGTLDFVHRDIHPDAAIMTEPTSLKIGPMCRGILWGKILIPAKAGHIEMYQEHYSKGGAVDGVKLLQLYLNQIDMLNREWAVKRKHPLLPMPCQVLVSQVRAGEYPSAYAGFAEISFNAQYLPEDLDEKYRGSKVKKEIEEFVAAVAQTNEWLRENPPHVEWLMDSDCAETPQEHPFVQTLRHAAEEIDGKSVIEGVGSHADIGWFVRTGTPTVNFGPGDPKIAHQADEYVELEEYIRCIKILAEMILEWCETEQLISE